MDELHLSFPTQSNTLQPPIDENTRRPADRRNPPTPEGAVERPNIGFLCGQQEFASPPEHDWAYLVAGAVVKVELKSNADALLSGFTDAAASGSAHVSAATSPLVRVDAEVRTESGSVSDLRRESFRHHRQRIRPEHPLLRSRRAAGFDG